MWLGILIAAAVVIALAGAAHARTPKGPKPRPGVTDVSARLDAFWAWWRTAAPRVAAALDARDADAIVRELSERVHAIDAGIAWEVGPGLKGARHQLVLSSEGDRALRVVVERWLSRAPSPDAQWEYYPARQPAPRDSKFSLDLHDAARTHVAFDDVRVAVETDALREIVHVTFHHPAFAKLPEDERTRAAFLVLDNLVGEDGVERWIGGIQTSATPLPDGKPIEALADAVASLARSATGEGYATLDGRTGSGRPVIASANVALKRVDHLLMDHHLEVAFPFREEAGEGLPTKDEQDAGNALEDELVDVLGHDAVWIGHEIGDGRRAIHLHVAGQGPAEARARAWAAKHADRRISIEVRHDPGWDVLRKWR